MIKYRNIAKIAHFNVIHVNTTSLIVWFVKVIEVRVMDQFLLRIALVKMVNYKI